MKKNLFYVSLFSVLALSIISCEKSKVNTEEIATQKVENIRKHTINIEQSKIEWKGFKIFKSENTSHLGIINFSKGELHTLQDGVLVGGMLTADMQSIENFDLTDTEAKTKLENHLKSEDFFAVEKFPTAQFEITNVIASNEGDYNRILEGKLTIKNTTKPLKIRANVLQNDGQISIFTEPTDINREEFGVSFQSPLENGVIKNEIQIQAIIKSDFQ